MSEAKWLSIPDAPKNRLMLGNVLARIDRKSDGSAAVVTRAIVGSTFGAESSAASDAFVGGAQEDGKLFAI